jgi:hypothetical protein
MFRGFKKIVFKIYSLTDDFMLLWWFTGNLESVLVCWHHADMGIIAKGLDRGPVREMVATHLLLNSTVTQLQVHWLQSLCLSVCLSLSLYLSIYLSIYLSLCLVM